MALPDPIADLVREEVGNGFDPLLRRAPGDVYGGIDPQYPHAALAKEAEQRAVVAAELDDQGVRRKRIALDDVIGISREMLAQAERERCRIDVMAVLDLRISDMENLQVSALPAGKYIPG